MIYRLTVPLEAAKSLPEFLLTQDQRLSKQKTVFVVDDDPGMLKGVKRLLRAHGYDCLLFQSGEALEDHGDFEHAICVILDINLILDWGYNRQRAYTGALPEEFTGVWTRIIPLNSQRPPLSPKIRMYMGDARGHWEGATLVVETTNLKAGTRGSSPSLRLTEKFTRVDADTLEYTAVVDDPKTYTRPFTIQFPWRRDNSYGMYEYACHEGNHSLFNILSGARADDRAAGTAVRP